VFVYLALLRVKCDICCGVLIFFVRIFNVAGYSSAELENTNVIRPRRMRYIDCHRLGLRWNRTQLTKQSQSKIATALAWIATDHVVGEAADDRCHDCVIRALIRDRGEKL
jgi:hypothetical protein